MAAGLLMVAGAPLVVGAAPAGAATQVTASTESQFWAAWTDASVTQIDLANSIQLHSGNGNGTCSPNTYPERHATGPLLVDGHGFTLTQNCDQNAVLFVDSGAFLLTVQNITLTHAGAPTPIVTGNGIVNDGDVIVHNSTITGNWTGNSACGESASVHAAFLCAPVGGGILSNDGNVSVDGSTISNNRAEEVGGGILADGTVTISNSSVTDNQVSGFDGVSYGGGIYAGSGVTATDTQFASNLATNCDECEAVEGGAIASADGATVSGSSFTGNHAECTFDCGNYGGAISVGGALDVSGSTFSDNQAICENDCAADGGAISAYGGNITPTAASLGVHALAPNEPGPGAVTIADSTFSGNQATTTSGTGGDCDCSGGGLLIDGETSLHVTGSAFNGNTAYYDGGAFDVYSEDSASSPAVTVVNSTVTGNTSGDDGAIDASDDGVSLTLAYDTIDGNTTVSPTAASSAAGAWAHVQGTGSRHAHSTDDQVEPANLSAQSLTSFGTVVTDPMGGVPNCRIDSPPTTSDGWNYSDDASCGFTNTAQGDLQNAGSPGLNPLGDNGGPTSTMLPLTPLHGGTTSPLIDAIPVASCQAGVAAGVGTDQRGITRPQLFGCDIGAVEVTGDEYQVKAAEVIAPKFTG